jgi:NADH:ubiquinone oxidoreductase subunit D
MKLRLRLEGEVITACEVETGFLHRGLEKALELHLWQSSIAYADHLDPEAAVFGELALCLAVEEIMNLEVPPRAQVIRIILSELARVSSHLVFIARMARAVGSETVIHYVLRDRERVLDLFELLSGARFSLNFLRFGGVCADVTEGFIERVQEACELIRIRLREYNDLFTYNHAFLGRTQSVGVISTASALSSSLTGPNARASGVSLDVRRDFPYSGYQGSEFPDSESVISGDAHARFLLRLREIGQSVEILRQETEQIPRGEFASIKVDKDFKVSKGESYQRVESARGLLGCYVVSEGGRSPARVQFRPPTYAALAILPALARGVRLEDLPIIMASLDLGIAEADR